MTTWFHGFHRPHHGVSPHSYSSMSPRVPEICLQDKLPVQSPNLQASSKVIMILVALLCYQGIHVHLFLDDLQIRSPSRMQARTGSLSTTQCPACHGFLIISAKSNLIPSQQIEDLGITTDFSVHRLYLPEKSQKVSDMERQLINSRSSLVMTLARLKGLMIACLDTVPSLRFQLRPLQWLLRHF